MRRIFADVNPPAVFAQFRLDVREARIEIAALTSGVPARAPDEPLLELAGAARNELRTAVDPGQVDFRSLAAAHRNDAAARANLDRSLEHRDDVDSPGIRLDAVE
jgi:hypothetical protein